MPYRCAIALALATSPVPGTSNVIARSPRRRRSGIALNNTTTVGAWTALDKVFAGNLSGQTIRLRFTSTNDDSFVTNFFFDTLALTATYCQ